MQNKWKKQSRQNHEKYMQKAGITGSMRVNFLALALCGEAGELANLVKKMWLGKTVDAEKLRMEIADIYIYLLHIADELGYNLDRAAADKVEIVSQRPELSFVTNNPKIIEDM